MPIVEINYNSRQEFSPEGKSVSVPPRQVLQSLGPTLSVVISVTKEHQERLIASGQKVPEPVSGAALIDTGASITAVDEKVSQALGLISTGLVEMAHAGGRESRSCYPIQILFPGTPLPALYCPRALSVDLGSGAQPHVLLLGRNLLAHLRMVYNGPRGRIEIAF